MPGTIELDGERYDRGSTEHLEKIDSLHKSEISKQTEAYVQDLYPSGKVSNHTRESSTRKLADGVREQSVALVAEANEATPAKARDRVRLLVNGVKDHALLMLDPDGNVASWNAGAEHIMGCTTADESRWPVTSRFSTARRCWAAIDEGRPLAHALRGSRAPGSAEDVRASASTRTARSSGQASRAVCRSSMPAGEAARLWMISRDLRERRSLEDQLHDQSQKDGRPSVAWLLA